MNSKYNKKVSRCCHLLKKMYPNILIRTTDADDYAVLFLGNCGHVTGQDEASILSTLASHSADRGISEITLIVGCQFSFVSYQSPKEAQQALDSICNSKETAVIYATLVNEVPTLPESVHYSLPANLRIVENFINEEEEQNLMQLIDWQQNPNSDSIGSSLKQRQVRHFGYQFEYGSNSIDASKPLLDAPIPGELLGLMQRMVSQGIIRELPDQVTANRYLPGQGIPSHIDTHSACTDELVSLSLGCDTVMEFVKEVMGEENHREGEATRVRHSVLLPSKSLCVMKKEVRYIWQHGIRSRSTDVYRNSEGEMRLLKRRERVSFTFRKTRTTPCDCDYKSHCDSYIKQTVSSSSVSPSLGSDPASVEAQHVHSVYEDIASHFSDTRHTPWPNVKEFVCSLPSGNFLLDVGCGNGKYLQLNKSIFEVGCDTSTNLLNIVRTRNNQAVCSNCLVLPFKTGTFDAVICIAVIHHLASESRRQEAVAEMLRILTVGGRGLIYVWALEQSKGGKKSSYLKQKKENEETTVPGRYQTDGKLSDHQTLEPGKCTDTKLPELPVHQNRTNFKQQDNLVPWKLKGDGEAKVFHRYYHTFHEGELESLCERIKGLSVQKSYYDNGNWCVEFCKQN